ncbi:ferric iron reductase [Pararhizobium sp. O133]|uniref:ferric iron reductase n=1 Tax=Pararhizobium sp. O133 TaxID=3449278 RepID=UPI003F68938C
MNDTRYTGSSSALDAERAMAWQAETFPQVSASLGDGEGCLSVFEAWRADSVWLADCLDYQNRFAAGMDERTRGAHLMAFYCHHLSIAAGAIHLKTGLVADLDPQHLAVRFESYDLPAQASAGHVRRFHFRFSSFLTGASANDFHDSFVKSLMPVVEALQARTGLSAAAQWRLAADGITGAFLEIGSADGDEEGAIASALAIVKLPGSPLLSSELHYEQIEAERDGVPVERIFRLRSGCCLFYRTQGGNFCDVCVLLDSTVQRSRLRDHLARAGSP